MKGGKNNNFFSTFWSLAFRFRRGMDLGSGSFSSITGRLKLSSPLETFKTFRSFFFSLQNVNEDLAYFHTMHFNLWWNCTCKWKMEILHPMNFFSPFIFQPVEKQEKLCALNLQRDSRAQKIGLCETSFSHWCALRRSHDYYYVLFLGFHISVEPCRC